MRGRYSFSFIVYEPQPNMTATKTKIPSFESASPAGTNPSRKPGSGCEPITLSTAIARGTGVSRASGAASMLMMKMAAMWSRYGRTSRATLRYSPRSV